jgi:peptidoglycan/LPS O-acetylase OafA/YrhL
LTAAVLSRVGQIENFMEQPQKAVLLKPARYEDLESIRGVAALLVVFFHLPKWNPILDVGVINNSYLMVELFFVLSGFVIFNAYHSKIVSLRDLLRFQFLRFGRLYPVHLLFLFAFVFIECAKYIAEHKFGLLGPNTRAFEINDLQAFAQNLLLVSGLLPTERLTFNGPAWSICVEFYTYLVFALIMLYAGRLRALLLTLIPGIALVLMGSGNSHGFEHLLQCLAGFFLGCWTAIFVNQIKFEVPSFVSLATLLTIVVFLQTKSTMAVDLLIYPLSALLIASLVLSSDGLVKRMLNLRQLKQLGAVSYSLYMCHAAVEWAGHQSVRLLMKKPEFIDTYGNSIPRLNAGEALLATLLITVAVVAVSALSYRFVENPMRERSRDFARRRLT